MVKQIYYNVPLVYASSPTKQIPDFQQIPDFCFSLDQTLKSNLWFPTYPTRKFLTLLELCVTLV